MKYIIFDLKDGSSWGLPLKLVAVNRAKHYAEDPDTTFEEEFDLVMDNPYEGIDWYQNNCNPEDFKITDYKRIAPPATYSLFEMLGECEDMEIGEHK